MKSRLKAYKYLVLQLNRTLQWTEERDAHVIIALVTLSFLFIWTTGMSVISTISLFLFGVLVFTSLVEYVCNKRDGEELWNDAMEEEYDNVCLQICSIKIVMDDMWRTMEGYYGANPFRFKVFLGTCLLTIAYIGSIINNLLICYLITLTASLYPGLSRHGYVNHMKHLATQNILILCNYLKTYSDNQQRNLKYG